MQRQVPVDLVDNHVEGKKVTHVNDVTHSQFTINITSPIAMNGSTSHRSSLNTGTHAGHSQVTGRDVTHLHEERNTLSPLHDFPDSPNASQDDLGNSLNDINGNNLPDSNSSNVVEKTLKFLNWNTEGFLEKINLDGFCDFINSFDIIGLGETFTNINFDFSIKFKEFEAIHNPAEQFSHLGRPSGGLVLLVKKTLKDMIEIVDSGISHILSLKIKKECLNSTQDVLYINTCTSNR